MKWLVEMDLDMHEPHALESEKPQFRADITDYQTRNCMQLGYCNAEDKKSYDEGIAQDA